MYLDVPENRIRHCKKLKLIFRDKLEIFCINIITGIGNVLPIKYSLNGDTNECIR